MHRWRWRRANTVFSILTIIAILAAPMRSFSAAASQQTTSECGVWKAEESTNEKDQRIRVVPVTVNDGSCPGIYTLSNQTSVQWRGLSFGGYTLELETNPINATAQWTPPGDSDGKNYLTPLMALDIRTMPLDVSSKGTVSIHGNMTWRSLMIDSALFLLKAFLELAPLPTGCLISEDQLAFAAIRASFILEPVVDLVFKRDFPGVGRELLSRLGEFIEGLGDYMEDASIDCGVEWIAYVRGIAKKPVAIAKLVAAYLAWIPVVWIDYWKYKGEPASVMLSYTPVWSPKIGIPRGEIAYIGEDNNIWTLTLPENEARRLTSEGTYYEVTWSPYGNQLAFARGHDADSEIGLMKTDGTRLRIVINAANRPTGRTSNMVLDQRFRSIRWSPYAHSVYWLQPQTRDSEWASCQREAYGVAVVTQMGDISFGTNPFGLYFGGDAFDLSPDGEGVAVSNCATDGASNTRHVIEVGFGYHFVIPIRPNFQPDFLPSAAGDQTDPAWSLNGESLAFVSDGRLAVYEIQKAQVSFLNVAGTSPKWSPDGNWIAFSDGNHILLVDRDGNTEPVKIAKGRRPEWKPVYVGSGVDTIVGFWKGDVYVGAEWRSETIEKTFEIRVDCPMGRPCIKTEDAVIPLVYGNRVRMAGVTSDSPTYCFSAEGLTIHCFTPQPDGTLDYFVSGALWGGSGILYKIGE